MGKTVGGVGVEARKGGPVRPPERPADEASEPLGPEVKDLIEKGKERGFVTVDELNKVLPDDEVSPEKLDAVLQKLDDLGIEMVESAAEEGGKEAVGGEPDEEAREFEGPREREPREPKTPGGSAKIDDPVRLYLTQMGQIPLLSREDELRLASRIELTRKRFRAKVLESPVAVAEAIAILEEVKNGDLAFDRTLKADSSIEFPKISVLERLPGLIDRLRQTVFDS
ncbi:MAG TPA: RNA polymerase sigma factor region1.1 domain-containing protein, partial [Planctomycetota bacterium]|nr:RNA polymerase sigma factor region1.1 domain-containing protein [Planctomycetota bacterium]